MRDWLSFAVRNPSHVTKHARHQNSVRRAMYKHRKEHPTCALTGESKIAIHHIVPVSVAPELADDPGNFISLHPKVHLWLAHFGSYTRHTRNIVDVVEWLKNNMEVVSTSGYVEKGTDK